jgi:hypothetical protein
VVRFEVFIHMPLLEDYTAAENNLQAAVDNRFGAGTTGVTGLWTAPPRRPVCASRQGFLAPLRNGRAMMCATRWPCVSGLVKTDASRVLGSVSATAVTPDAATTTGRAAANVGNAATKNGWKTTDVGLPG